ncbi:hypothetical protein N7510_000521 [Penicillium lagena]|uniref:uncharacterized protein n=1 Tax=Penicillium lagena TaxID=94218 RepID=UPI00253FF1F7|nr:uncharacterized protein N7510_000521 [Penicillium lagena]KAJ5624212.1 hypothetical protein N7510_000521 [Penicillium lagena]
MAAPQQPPASSPRRSRGYSFKSDSKTHRSSTSGHRSQLSESVSEKERRLLHTKADPLVAMNEAQPMAVALEKSNLGSLREIQHKDQYGNPITDPDLSNPTRPRLERPLDTIRSFEAAIYGTYNSNRMSFVRTDDASQAGDYSRRTSYYGGNNYNNAPQNHMNRGYTDQSYYSGGGRGTQSRPDSMVDGYQNAGGQAADNNYYPYQNNQTGRSRPRQYSRMSTDQAVYANNSQAGYPQQGYQRSYDNVAAISGSGSGYTDPYGQSTDPSSINSSMDQLQQQAMQQHRMDERVYADTNGYGYQGGGGGGYGQTYNANGNANSKTLPSPPVPAHDPSYWGGPVGGSSAPQAPLPRNHLRKNTNTNQSTPNEKRKSWFKRRFSRD